MCAVTLTTDERYGPPEPGQFAEREVGIAFLPLLEGIVLTVQFGATVTKEIVEDQNRTQLYQVRHEHQRIPRGLVEIAIQVDHGSIVDAVVSG